MKTEMTNIKSLGLFFVIILALFASFSANAKDLPALDAAYKVYISGIHIADMKAKAEKSRLITDIDTKGLTYAVSGYKNHAETDFRYEKGEYVPVRFSKHSEHTFSSKQVQLDYAKGVVKQQRSSVNFSDSVMKNAKVMGAIDPLAAIVIAREKIRKSLHARRKHFTVPVYDGKKLARLDFVVDGIEHKEIEGASQSLIHVKFTRVAISGFDDAGENPVVDMYLSNDGKFIPVMASTEASLGHIVMMLDKNCCPASQCV